MDKDLVKALTALANVLTAILKRDLGEDTPVADAPKGKGKKGKAAPVEDEVEEVTDDMGIEEEATEEEDEVEEISVDDVKKAFQKYVKKFDDVKKGRAAAKKVLTKFKASNIDELVMKDYAKVIASLK